MLLYLEEPVHGPKLTQIVLRNSMIGMPNTHSQSLALQVKKINQFSDPDRRLSSRQRPAVPTLLLLQHLLRDY